MKIIKPQRLSLLTRTYEYEGKFYLAANIMAFFSFAQPERFLSEQSMWKFVAEALGKDAVLDMGLPKQRGEFLIHGKCFAPKGQNVTQAAVRAKVAGLEKSLVVTGNRVWKNRGVISVASEPDPFSSMDLNYANAFGGDGFADNPLGKGMPPKDNALPHFLPNIDSPHQPVVFLDDRPHPASFAPMDFTWPQRFSKAGTHDKAWLQTRFPGFAADMDWSIFNTAQPDQILPAYFAGAEAFEVQGMHPEKPTVRGTLPGCAMRCFVTQKSDPSMVLRDVPTRAETLVLFPGAERAVLIFRGVTEISTDDGADIAHILIGSEDIGAAKPIAHYQTVLHQRLDRKNGAIACLIDEPLLHAMPDSTSGGDASDADAMDILVRPKGLLRKNLLRKSEQMLSDAKVSLHKTREELIAACAAAGLPAPDLSAIDKALAQTIPPDPPPPRLEELPALREKLEKMLADGKAEALVKQAEAEATLRQTCTEQKLDYDKLVADARRESAGPPKPIAQKTLDQMRATADQLQAQGHPSAELNAKLSDAKLHDQLSQADVAVMSAYRQFVHVYPPVGSLEGEAAQVIRQNVVAAIQRGEKFTGCDFSGADFSGLKLAGCDFSSALMEGVNFSMADLTGCNFSKAVMVRAIFTNAALSKANFTGANLGFCLLADVDASEANFSGARLAGADLTGVNFRGADLTMADLMGTKLVRADFSGANAAEVKFIEVNLLPNEASAADMEGPQELPMHAIKFVGAKLTKAVFLNCRMDGADFTEACLDKATFLTAVGSQINFSRASLKGFCVVKDSQLQRANFSGADMEKANFRGTDLHLSVFKNANLSHCDLSECVLTSADFKLAAATNIQLVKANLMGADFSGANLQQANLQKANMVGTLFWECNLFMADFLRCKYDGTTVFERANRGKTLLRKSA